MVIFVPKFVQCMEKKSKSLTFYTLMILIVGLLMYVVLHLGENQHVLATSATSKVAPANLSEGYQIFKQLFIGQLQSTFGLLLMQIVVILIVCRFFGLLFKQIGQPAVIGEITAGIMLGPSILGHFFPEISNFLFPLASLTNINLLSQFGLILFMFVLGMELDMVEVRKRFFETISISHISMIVPFFMGIVLAYFIYDRYAYHETHFLSFALFIGIALSITAFPVLARIIQEKKLTRTHLGTVALASAASGDITAWCILAAVVAIAQTGSMLSAIYNIAFAILYMLVMFFVVRPLLRMIGNLYHNKEVVAKPLITLMFLLMLISAFVTEILGLHALFGAFIVGVIMPENIQFRKIMTEKVEDVALVLFLPLFFVSTGLRTEIGLLNSQGMWILCAVFIAIAVVGKMGGAIMSARSAGENWHDSIMLGGLMNARGLMELVVLAIGYDLKILPPPIFVMLVLMTLITTFMTVPLLSFIGFCFKKYEKIKGQMQEKLKEAQFRVLLSFGRAESGQVLLDVAHQMFSEGQSKLDLTALHLTVGSDVNPLHTESFEKDNFEPILTEASKLNMQIHTRYEVSANAGLSIVTITNQEMYDFLLVGAGVALSNLSSDISARKIYKSFFRVFNRMNSQSPLFFPNALIHDKTKFFIEQSRCSVGVFVNRNFTKATRILIVINALEDVCLLNYAKTLAKSTQGTLSVINGIPSNSPSNELIMKEINDLISQHRETVILPAQEIKRESFAGYNFMLISYAAWNTLSATHEKALQDMPSTLIIKHV